MPPFLRRIVVHLAPRSYAYYRAFTSLILDKNSYLHTTGWIQSLTEEIPVDSEGGDLPWMNFPVIHFLTPRLSKDLTLFDFGSGYSTTFFAKLVNHVTSVEYDEKWFEIVKKRVPENVRLIYQPQDSDGHYCRTVHASGQKFELIIVDGRDRVNCLKQSLSALSETGVLILDDSQRDKYREAFEHAHSHGFRSLDFDGLKPTHFDSHRTTIFYRSDRNCLGI